MKNPIYWFIEILNYPAWKLLTHAAVPVDQTSVVRGWKVAFVFADMERDAICRAYDCVVLSAFSIYAHWLNYIICMADTPLEQRPLQRAGVLYVTLSLLIVDKGCSRI
jgi:hypothetical protein